MTCWNAVRHDTSYGQQERDWGVSPSYVIWRYLRGPHGNPPGIGHPLDAELRAIVALIDAHPDEFAGYLVGLDQTVSLSARRRAAGRRAN
jgi:hypothetical protein